MKNFPSEITETNLAALRLLGYEIKKCGDHWHMEKDRSTVASRFRGTVEWDFTRKYAHEAKQVEKILGVRCATS